MIEPSFHDDCMIALGMMAQLRARPARPPAVLSGDHNGVTVGELTELQSRVLVGIVACWFAGCALPPVSAFAREIGACTAGSVHSTLGGLSSRGLLSIGYHHDGRTDWSKTRPTVYGLELVLRG